MPTPPRYLRHLEARHLLPPDQATRIGAADAAQPFSLHYELRAFLYLGITLLAGGLSVLVYQHIDSIGHGVIIAAMAALMAACFAYAARHRAPFTWGIAPKASVGADYLLLLGCLLFVALEGYVQYQYQLFGNRYGVATVLPALIFLPLAYGFDHRGVLAMGLTALASWVGVAVSPLAVLADNDFWNESIRAAALGLGLVLLAVGFYSEFRGRKAHFAFTYLLLGSNLALAPLAASILSASFDKHATVVFGTAVVMLALCAGLFWYARRAQSYWFLLLSAAYAYLAVCCAVAQVLIALPDEIIFFALLVFLPLSAVVVILFFVNLKKIMHPGNDALPDAAPPTFQA